MPQEEEKVAEDPESYSYGSEDADAAIMNEAFNPILFTELLPLIGRVPMSKYRLFKLY